MTPLNPLPRTRRVLGSLCATLLSGHLAHAVPITPPPAEQPPELPVEQLAVEKLQPPDAYRVYVADPSMPHLVDGRAFVLDAKAMRFLGMTGTGFSGIATPSRDGKMLYTVGTYHSRLQRGSRTDVVEAYSTDDLALRYEVVIPPKHVQGMPTKALISTTANDRFLLVQNATPATSVTVVDLQSHQVASEIPLPGCYGVIPWPTQTLRFSAVCGDGSFTTVTLSEQGQPAKIQKGPVFFNPDKDPIFMHYQMVGETLHFISYYGTVHEVSLAGDAPVAGPTWSIIDPASRLQGWRPSGFQLFAIEPKTQRLYVGMHDHGKEGSHKTPAKELWVFDLTTHQRVARAPGQNAIGMAITPTTPPRLVLLNGTDNTLLGIDLKGDKAPLKPIIKSEPVGESPVFLGVPG
jgi:methylamine dehydrogenase heavy chain